MSRKGVAFIANVVMNIRANLERGWPVTTWLLNQLSERGDDIARIAEIIPPCEDWQTAFGPLQGAARPEARITIFVFFRNPLGKKLACEIFAVESKEEFTVNAEEKVVMIRQGFRLSGRQGFVTNVTIDFLECQCK